SNAQSSPFMSAAVFFSTQFRLGLLFFISGCGVFYALRHRTQIEFLRERSWRLLIPLAFGILVLVPPMVYLEKRYIGEIDACIWSFLSSLLTNGAYPKGNLSWHHFWFIAYLYLFCLVGLRLFDWLRSSSGRNWLDRLARRVDARPSQIYLVIVPLLLIELVLRPFFPGFRNLIADWASFNHWFVLFICGFVVAARPVFLQTVEILRWRSLVLAAASSAILLSIFWDYANMTLKLFPDGSIDVSRYIFFSSLRAINAWAWLLVCVGFAARYLNRPSKLISYLNKAVYPFFCLHLTVLVVLEFWILPLSWSIATKYLVLTTLAVMIILVCYEALKRIRFVRPLIGLSNG
ncbi:MAG: acyltransferase family protein, partial [Pseudomonadota bacterium]